MKITVLKVTVNEVQGQKGPYKTAEVVYKSDDKVKTHKVVSWNKDVFAVVSNATSGDILDVSFEKDSKGYWQMTRASKEGKADVAGATSVPAKGNWETAEERQAKQMYIVKQSSIAAAVELAGNNKEKASPEDIIKVAKQFVDYVFGYVPTVTTQDVE
jgi:hypothetical protein